MLQETLIILENALQQGIASELIDIKKAVEFFGHYKQGQWLYPGVLKRKFSLNIKESYMIMESLEKAKIIDSYFELCCGCCQKTNGTIVRVLNELPETFICELCGAELPSIKNAFLIYKVR